jgi:ankyrin repeat protein
MPLDFSNRNNWDPLLAELMRCCVYDPQAARDLVKKHPDVLEMRTGLGETALQFLAIENCASAVQLLIDLGARVNVTNRFGESALYEARSVGAREAVEALLGAGAR